MDVHIQRRHVFKRDWTTMCTNMGTILGLIVDITKGDLNDQFTRSGPMEGPLTLDLFICNTKMVQRPMRSHSLG